MLVFLFTATLLTYLPTHASPQEKFWKIAITVSAPAGTPLEASTPIIIKLGLLADAMPAEVDPFGENTGEEGDDADWAATYLFLGDTRMPHQVDDVDGVPGFSDGDELVFQTPSTIAAGSSETFSLYFTTKDVELPAPRYPLINAIKPYPLKDYINWVIEPGIPENTIGESYVMDNGNISAAVLVEGAWMSSCIYQLIVNETGFDIVKQNLEVEVQTEPYKWTRFAMPADVGWLENNPNPTSGVFERLFIKPGPVRSILKMRSTASYDKVEGIYALVTYTMYANQSWLDYQLDITGPEVTSGMTLDVNLMNREWAGVAGTIYDTVHIPGREDLSRLAKFDVPRGDISEGWYIIYNKTKAKGFGMSFDIEGLNMIAWSKITEGVSVLYGNPSMRVSTDNWFGPTMDANGMKFPFHARYYPIDSSITTLTPTEYMATMYAGWLTEPGVSVQTAEETTLPFDYIKVEVPTVNYDFDTKSLNITGVTAVCSEHGTIDDTNYEVAEFFVYSSLGLPTGIEGDLAWSGSDWQALNVDLSSLPEGLYYVKCYFKDVDAEGVSKPSQNFGEFVDVKGPTIGDVSWSPKAPTDQDNVTVTVNVTDISGVKDVILSYFDGSQWVNTTMVKVEDIYTGVVPKAAGGAEVQFKIYAQDNAGNWRESNVYSYTVQITTTPMTITIGVIAIAAVFAAVIGFAYVTKRIHRREYEPVVK